MKHKMRVVIDTNVIVSAVLLPRSVARQLFDFVILNGKILVSEQTLSELNEVLCRHKFDKYIPEQKRLEFFSALVREAEMIHITHIVAECRDEKDNQFLELAISGYANYIVSGDKDLLVLNPFHHIQIISPSAFFQNYSTAKN